jgi:putative ATP-dependent endonuclease of OLD family
MEIASLRIENFRGVQNGMIRFSPHIVLIGSNNCGKTTVIEASFTLKTPAEPVGSTSN